MMDVILNVKFGGIVVVSGEGRRLEWISIPMSSVVLGTDFARS